MIELIGMFLEVNGSWYWLSVELCCLFCDLLCDDLGLIGTNVFCELGVCGVCMVLLDGKVVWFCLTFVVQVNGIYVEIIELLFDGIIFYFL